MSRSYSKRLTIFEPNTINLLNRESTVKAHRIDRPRGMKLGTLFFLAWLFLFAKQATSGIKVNEQTDQITGFIDFEATMIALL